MKEISPPHSQESEMVILGSMLNDPENLQFSIDELNECDFYLKNNQMIFRMIKTLYHENQIIDIYTLGEKLKDQSLFKESGGIGYLATLSQYAGSAPHIEEYIRLIKGKTILRRLLEIIDLTKQEALILTSADIEM
jgi:replicative DNA helicase